MRKTRLGQPQSLAIDPLDAVEGPGHLVCNDGRERYGVLRHGERVVRNGQGVAVQEIEIAAFVQAVQNCVLFRLRYRAPAHIRYGNTRIGRQTFCRSPQYPQTFDVVFLGAFSQQLHAQADSEYGLSEVTYDINQVGVFQAIHGVTGSADSGQHDTVGTTDFIHLDRQARLRIQTLKCVQKRRDVRAAAVDDRNIG